MAKQSSLFLLILILTLTFGTQRVKGAGLRILADDDIALAARIQVIQGAQADLNVAWFELKDDRVGQSLSQELCHAADRGVKVRLILDAMHDKMSMAQRHSLKQHGVNIKWYHPIGTGAANLMRRMHDKYLAADQNQLILGSRNIGDVYFGQSIKKKNFIDLDVQISGPFVAQTMDYFEALWNSAQVDFQRTYKRRAKLLPNSTAPFAPVSDIVPRDTPAARPQNVDGSQLLFAHDDRGVKDPRTGIHRDIHDFLSNAEKSILIVSPYFHPTPELVGILYSAQCRGVSVKVLTNSLESTNRPINHVALVSQRDRRLNAIEILEYNGDLTLHAKGILVDGSRACVTSYNCNRRSQFMDTELALFVESEEFSRNLQAYFSPFLEESSTLLPKKRNELLNHSSLPKAEVRKLQWFARLIPNHL